ncbi:MAG: amidohydrolase family protein [Thermoproteota archaeon]|nr:amidohydrolase family protein [Thermoproteota archaeon]
MQHKSNSISSFFSSSPSAPSQKDPSASSSSLSQDRMNNDIVSVLMGPTLIDGTGDPPKSNTVIITNGNKIVAVMNETEYHDRYYNSPIKDKAGGVNILNLTGKYVMPGLFDMHAHVAGVRKNSYNQDLSETTLKMLLDYGVTTIRNPGGPTNQSIALKINVSKGILEGPEIYTAGRLLNGPQITIPFVEKQISDEEEAREEVRNQAAAGVDYVKLYVGLPPNLVKAAIDEAHRQGIGVIGHLYLTSWTDAAKLGIDALTHGVPVNPSLLPAGVKREAFLENGGGPFDHFLWLDLVDLNSVEIREMIRALVENHIPVDPTLSIYEAMLKEDGFFNPQNQLRWAKILQLTKMMYDNGVEILSGSDIPNFGLIPGASLHNELELLTQTGIKPLEVIEIATHNGAKALGIDGLVGTIQPEKQADMIVLSANPVENISNTKQIEAVMVNGKFVN